MLSKVNKVNKDNPIFVSFLLYFVPTLLPFILTPPFIMNLRVRTLSVNPKIKRSNILIKMSVFQNKNNI